MSRDIDLNDPADEREALLPWYVTGRLSAEERRQVEDYLQDNPQAQLQLDLIREELDETVSINEQIQAPSARMLDSLMAQVEAMEGPEREKAGGVGSLLRALTGFLPEMAPSGLRVAALAAALLVCVQAGAIAWLVIGDLSPGAPYRTASGGPQTAAGPRALVGFRDGVTLDQITAFLSERKLAIMDGPKPGGLYVIRLGPDDMSDEDAGQVLEELRAQRGIVRLATPVR